MTMNPNKVVLSEKDFEELFDLHFENLMGFVCSYVRDEEVAKDIVKTYLDAEFQGGRHEKRIAMIHEIENKR